MADPRVTDERLAELERRLSDARLAQRAARKAFEDFLRDSYAPGADQHYALARAASSDAQRAVRSLGLHLLPMMAAELRARRAAERQETEEDHG